MTLPNERYKALVYARRFLESLMDSRSTPKIPLAIRQEAYYRLKHYPSETEIESIAISIPEALEVVNVSNFQFDFRDWDKSKKGKKNK